MNGLVVAITDFGDSSVLLAMTLLGAVYLGFNGAKVAAAMLVSGVLATSAVVALVKVVVMGCGSTESAWNIHSPSGHTAMSVVVFGLLAHILSRGTPRPVPHLARLSALALAAMIGVSRIALGVHSWQEVVAGALIGLILLAVCEAGLRSRPIPLIQPGRMAALCLGVAVCLHGIHLPAEDMIRQVASLLRSSSHVCVARAAPVMGGRRLGIVPVAIKPTQP